LDRVVETSLLCVSDDLTGAVACGAELRRHGLSVSVSSWELPLPDRPDAVVVDTASRLLASDEAARRVAAVVASRGGRDVYKRIDSRLRGNVRAELEAVTEALGRPALIAPAAPAYGITTEGGIQHCDGNPLRPDDVEGPASARLADVVGGDTIELAARPSVDDLERALGAYRFVICDAVNLADLDALADCARRVSGSFVAVGSYGLASALRRREARARIVVVAGSRDPVSERQLELAMNHCDAVVIRGDATTVAAEAVRAINEERPDGVIMIGGETASAVVRACGVESVEILAEPWPATPLVRFGAGALDGVRGIVKSGGRGDDAWLLYAIGMLT
jgi:D-threonate/D-erythronate kinase